MDKLVNFIMQIYCPLTTICNFVEPSITAQMLKNKKGD